MPKPRLWFTAAAFLGLLFLVWLRLHQPPNTVDDAYITFRYARNLATGVGFVYNPGDHVLGTTTPAYAVLLAVLSRVSHFYDYPRLALLTNTLLDATTFCLVARLAARLVGPRLLAERPRTAAWVGLGAGLLFAVDGRTLDFSTGGMEASFNVMAVVLTLLLFLEDNRPWVALALGLAVLIRPDGATLAAVLFAAWGLTALGNLRHEASWKHTLSEMPWKEAALFAAAVAPWVIFATIYFGNPIPQSILAKSELYRTPELMAFRAFLVQLRTVFPFSLPPLRDPEPLGRQLLQALLPTALCMLGLVTVWRRHPQAWVIGAYIALFIAFYSVGNPLWLGWYEIPMMSLYQALILAAAVWIGSQVARLPLREAPLWGSQRESSPGEGVGGWGTALAFVVVGLMTVPHLSRLNAIPWETPQRDWFVLNPAFNKRREEDYELLARMLRPAAEHDRLVAIPEIGAFGYVYPGDLFDTSGLISPPVLKYFPIPEHIPVEIYSVPREMIFDLQPDLFISFDSFMQATLPPDDPEFLALYYPTVGLTSHAAFGIQRLIIYRRAGLPVEVILPPEARPTEIRFGSDLVTLKGYTMRSWADLEHNYLEVALFWRGGDAPIGRDLLARVNLVSASGAQVYQVLDYPGEGLFPTAAWTPGMWLVDRYQLKRPAPDAGPYEVTVTVFPADADDPLPAQAADGVRLPADTFVMSEVVVP